MIVNLLENEQRKHKNGGGWVALTAEVDDSVFVAPFAIVYGHAILKGRVRILDLAQVSGSAKLNGNVVVCGHAWVDHGTYSGNEVISKNERVTEKKTRIK